MADEIEAILSVEVPLRLLATGATEGPRPAPDPDRHARLRTWTPIRSSPSSSRSPPPGFLVLSLQGPAVGASRGRERPPRSGSAASTGAPRHEPDDNRAVHRASVAEAIAWAGAHGGDPARVVLFGFSQPCSFNYRLALAPPHGVPFRAIAAICGGIPGEWKTNDPGTTALARNGRPPRLDARGRDLLSRESARALSRDPRVALPLGGAPPLRRRAPRALGVVRRTSGRFSRSTREAAR